MSNNGNVVDLLTPAERDQRILSLRLAGVSVAKIGAEYRLSDRAVLKVLDKLLPTLDASTRARYLRESLGTLDALQSWWMGRAKDNAVAAGIVLKVNESKRQLLGLDTNASSRLDPIRIVEEAKPDEDSTTAILRELNRIVAERPATREVTIETEAERDRGAKAEPEPAA